MTDTLRTEAAAIFAGLAVEAGQAIMQARGAASLRHKTDGSPVTQADLDADRIIRAGLARAMPSIPVVTEEAAETHRSFVGERFILVDPLDGTREFLAGHNEFTVNIALIANGKPAAGVIYAPALGRLYTAANDARRADVGVGSQPPALAVMQQIKARPVPDRGWRAVASRSHLDAETRQWLEANPIVETCSAGSSLKLCAVAQGDADVYPRLSPTMAWDIAAGHAILAAAGGSVEALDGQPLRYGENGFWNPAFLAWGLRNREG